MDHWHLQVPEEYDVLSLTRWVSECMSNGIPREIISFTLLTNENFRNIRQLEAKSQVEHLLSQVMVDRNLQGIEFEKEGATDEAIKLYESNIADWFSGNHPYDRLRIIYTKRGRIQDAIRVCESFIRVADEFISMGSKRGDLPSKREKFIEHANKLRSK